VNDRQVEAVPSVPAVDPVAPAATPAGFSAPGRSLSRAALARTDPVTRALMLRQASAGMGNAMLARWVDGNPADDKLADDVGKLGDLDDAGRIKRIQEELGGGDGRLIEILWNGFSDPEKIARANPDLFARSLDRAGGIANFPAFKALQQKFESDVEAVALGYLASNRSYVTAEMEKLGVSGKDEPPTAEQQHALRDVQKAAELIAKCDEAIERFKAIPVGYDWDVVDGPGRMTKSEKYSVNFTPDRKPMVPPGQDDAGFKSWEEVNREYLPVAALKAGLAAKSPAALAMTESPGSAKKVAGADLAGARQDVGASLRAMLGRIEKAVPLVGSELTYLDFPTIQNQLFAGAKASSGTNWSGTVEKALAKEKVSSAETMHLLATLGLGALSAAAFILAEFATAGLATFVLAGIGLGIGAGQAAASWSKYSDLSTAQAATVRPELAIVEKEQVDSALFTAILDTAFVFLDGAGAVVGGGRSARAGKALLDAAEEGLEASAEMLAKSITKDAKGIAALEKAVGEIGAAEVSRLSGKSYAELAEIAGKETPTGRKLLALAELGPEGAAKAAADAASKLPNLAAEIAAGTLTKEEANKVALDAIGHLGHAGAIKAGGGWKKLLAAVGDGPAGQALEGWRKSILKELEEFVARETDEATKAVRTGTKGPVNDLDIQAVGGEASLMADKANHWLAGRLGCGEEELKTILDAAVFVDPTRAHLYDVAKGLDPADRAAIMAKQAGYDKQFIFAARLHEAQAKGDLEAVARITAEAQAAGVTPWKGFKPLSASEAKTLSGQVDGWVKELETTTDAGRKSELVEKIGQAQSQLNASNPEAYLGGGTRIWVTERDAADLAAAGVSLETPLAIQQRVTSALTEGKFFDQAIATLRKPGANAAEIAGALKDLGKHGERVAAVLKAPGSSAGPLVEVGNKLKLLESQAKSGELIARLGSASAIEKEVAAANALLGQLKAESSAAIKALEAEAKAANITAEQLQALQDWTRFNIKLGAAADQVSGVMAAWVEAIHTMLRAAESGGGGEEVRPAEAPQ
jgi:hypothetical protein